MVLVDTVCISTGHGHMSRPVIHSGLGMTVVRRQLVLGRAGAFTARRWPQGLVWTVIPMVPDPTWAVMMADRVRNVVGRPAASIFSRKVTTSGWEG